MTRQSYKGKRLTDFPDLVDSFHSILNGDITPHEVHAGSNRRLWWQCLAVAEHVWSATPNRRAQGSGCPYCVGQRACATNSLATLYPELASQLHPTLNNGITAEQITAKSAKKLWWQCSSVPGHTWEAAVYSRSRGRGCPYCAGLAADETNSLAALYPELASQLHPTLNNGITADAITSQSNRRLHWQCPAVDEHVWIAAPCSRVRGSGCPACSSSGFDPTKPAILYLITDGSQRAKVGITGSENREQRIGSHLRNWGGGTLLDAVEGLGNEIKAREQRILRLLDRAGIRRGAYIWNKFDGYTETWSVEQLCVESLDELESRLLDLCALGAS